MICLIFEWKERTNIATAYPDFANWVSNMNGNTDWYKQTPKSEDVVSGTYSVSESAGTGTSGNLNDQVFQQLSASVSNVWPYISFVVNLHPFWLVTRLTETPGFFLDNKSKVPVST